MIVVAYIGAVLFGLAIGWIASRLLARQTGSAHVSHFAAVIAATGGGYVAVESGDRGLFGLYAIGLIAGFAGYVAVFHRLRGDKNKTATLLGLDGTD